MERVVTKDRGIIPRYVRLWLKERFGEEGLERVLERLDPAARAMLAKPVPHAWYPVELTRELYAAIDAEFGARDPDALPDLGRFVARRSVKGFLQYLVRFLSVDQLIQRIGAAWRRYHNGGGITVHALDNDQGRRRGLAEIKGYDAGPAGCVIMQGFIETLISSAGARNVEVVKKGCIHKGDEVCSWLISYEE